MQTILFTLMIIFMHAHDNASKDVLVKTKNGKSYLAKLGTAKNGVKDYKSNSEHKNRTGFVNYIHLLVINNSKMTYIDIQIICIRIKTIPPERRSSVIHGQPQRNLTETMKEYWEGWKKSRMLKLTTLNHWCFQQQQQKQQQNLVLSMSVMTQNMAAGKRGALLNDSSNAIMIEWIRDAILSKKCIFF